MRRQLLASGKSLLRRDVPLKARSSQSSHKPYTPSALSNQAVQRMLRSNSEAEEELGVADEIHKELTAYLIEKAVTIKLCAIKNDEKGLEDAFRELFGLYEQLLELLFGEDQSWLERRLWGLLETDETEPRIKSTGTQRTTKPPSLPKGNQNSRASQAKSDFTGSISGSLKEALDYVLGSIKDYGREKADDFVQVIKDIITSLAEEAYVVFEDLARFSKQFPVVISAANKVVHEFKKVEEKKLTQNLIIKGGMIEAQVINAKNLTWIDLVRIWFWEMGPKNLRSLEFGPDAITTQDVKELIGVRAVVNQAAPRLYAGDYDPYTRQISYGTAEFFNSVRNQNKAFNFLGTYNVTVTPEKPQKNQDDVTLHILVSNDASLQSFSRFRKPAKPGEANRSIIEKNRERAEPGVEIGSTLSTCWKWQEKVSLSLTPIPILPADKLRVKPPVLHDLRR